MTEKSKDKDRPSTDLLEKLQLVKRLMACKGWRPLSGMAGDECRIAHVEDDGSLRIVSFYGGMDDWVNPLAFRYLDFNDSATLGCIAFTLLPESWGRPEISVDYFDDQWWVTAAGEVLARLEVYGINNRAEALVAALECHAPLESDWKKSQ